MRQDINDLMQRLNCKDNSDDEWLQLEKDIHEFLKENHPEEEKRRLYPLGGLEVITIICDGIKRRRGMIDG